MREKLLRWAIFTVIVSLVPFGMIALNFWSDGKSFGLSDLWPKGELLLVSTAIAADAVGEVIGSKDTARVAKIGSAGLCVLVLFLSALWYAQIQDHPTYKADRVSSGSIVLFTFSIIASIGCKALAEK